MNMIISKQQLAASAKEALENWDADLMAPGQAKVLQAIIDNPHNFADNNGKVEIHTVNVWDYLEEVSYNLAE